ncbi:pilin [Acinetobacter junii]|uniref:pilin n=1 Tax=Acinetobacter junii TaxID=40215 RepID=UPI0021CD72B6|nr:pilin [Acinetobacter junii]
MNDASVLGSDIFSVKNMFFSNQSEFCLYGVSAPDNLGNSNNALTCELKNSASLNGKFVYLNRDVAGKWSCGTSSDIPEKYKLVNSR